MTVVGRQIIAMHHLGFSYLQAQGSGVFVFEDRKSMIIVLIHAAYVIVDTGLFAYLCNREFEQIEDLMRLLHT